MKEGKTKHLTLVENALIVTDALLSERNESSANHAKTGSMQNVKLSLTLSIKTFGKLSGSVPIVRGNVRQRTHRN